MICHKCAGRSTKRHHRNCERRGEGHKGRGARIAYLATLAVEHGLVLRVRRGRHGAGLSLPQARRYLTKRLAGGFFRGTQADMRTLAAEILNCLPSDVDVERGDPGEVLVRLPADASDADVARTWRALGDTSPATVALRVDRHGRLRTRAARGRDPWVGGKATG